EVKELSRPERIISIAESNGLQIKNFEVKQAQIVEGEQGAINMRKNKTTHMMAGIFIIIFTALFLVLTGRFIYIQATGEVNNVSLEEWAEKKRTSSYSISAERGKIFDKNGMILAYDRPTYRIFAII